MAGRSVPASASNGADPGRGAGAAAPTLNDNDNDNNDLQSKIKMMNMFTNQSIIPRLAGLSLAGKAITLPPAPRRRSPTLSRRELRRLIADMVD